MKKSLFPVLVCLIGLSALPLSAQPSEEDEAPPAERTIDRIALRVFGGHFSGGRYLDLPSLGTNTRLSPEADDVYHYNGDLFTDEDLEIDADRNYTGKREYDAPRKEIAPSSVYGVQMGFYLNDKFHLDLEATVTSSRSETSFYNSYLTRREILEVDEGFTCYTGGGNLMVDLHKFGGLGGYPTVGFGIGGIINRFSYLEDKTGLYFQLIGVWNHRLAAGLDLMAQVSFKNFSFRREELTYGEQVTYTHFVIGLAKFFDVPDLPPTELE